LQTMRSHLSVAEALGQFRPYFLGVFADAALHCGAIDDGRRAITAALSVAAERGEHFYDAELFRLRAALTVIASEEDWWSRAEGDFQSAIRMAECQGAALIRLRATTGLARLIALQDSEAARAMLSRAIDESSVSEGCADITEARSVLADLS